MDRHDHTQRYTICEQRNDIPSLVFKKIPKRFDTHTEPSNHFMGQAYACQTGIFPPKDETVNHRQNFTLSLSTLKPGWEKQRVWRKHRPGHHHCQREPHRKIVSMTGVGSSHMQRNWGHIRGNRTERVWARWQVPTWGLLMADHCFHHARKTIIIANEKKRE